MPADLKRFLLIDVPSSYDCGKCVTFAGVSGQCFKRCLGGAKALMAGILRVYMIAPALELQKLKNFEIEYRCLDKRFDKILK